MQEEGDDFAEEKEDGIGAEEKEMVLGELVKKQEALLKLGVDMAKTPKHWRKWNNLVFPSAGMSFTSNSQSYFVLSRVLIVLKYVSVLVGEGGIMSKRTEVHYGIAMWVDHVLVRRYGRWIIGALWLIGTDKGFVSVVYTQQARYCVWSP
ncbi:hypothetical protein DY000_02053096 [Brassica cretica]|uniref:Uncharacterized protein n=1 Tax=Brassica cretica TaxID=69181 RepID=A0ABQ7AEA7_BRACR|nr:hypothetical protein DY000_02053096 [Brassica cretica]